MFMRRLLLSLGVAACLYFSPQVAKADVPVCTNFISTTVASATTTQLIAGVAGKNIYVCELEVLPITVTSPTFLFESGTGGTCGTGTVTYGTAITGVANILMPFLQVTNDYIFVPPGFGFCLVTGGTVTLVDIWGTYAQI